MFYLGTSSQHLVLFLQFAYIAVMQNVTSSNRSGYDDLLEVYRQSIEAEEKACVLGTWILNHQKSTYFNKASWRVDLL